MRSDIPVSGKTVETALICGNMVVLATFPSQLELSESAGSGVAHPSAHFPQLLRQNHTVAQDPAVQIHSEIPIQSDFLHFSPHKSADSL